MKPHTPLRQLAAFMLFAPAICLGQSKPCPPASISVVGGATATTDCKPASDTLAKKYPGDIGIGADPDVIWNENFEEGSVAAVTARYNDATNTAGMSLTTSKPAKSGGAASLSLLSNGTGAAATDMYKNLSTGYEELYVRYYVKYQAGAPWHHTGVWFGGYNPPLTYAMPKAGQKPNGDDRFSIGFEPTAAGNNVPLDFYNYWMNMHSWMDAPSGTTAYYGNTSLQDSAVRATDDTWVCVEIHAKANQTLTSSQGADLEAWINDASVRHFTATSPLGYWVKDKFCPADTSSAACTNNRTTTTPLVPLDLQFRSTAALKFNYVWIQNYISDPGTGAVWFDDLVVAKRRIGCLQ